MFNKPHHTRGGERDAQAAAATPQQEAQEGRPVGDPRQPHEPGQQQAVCALHPEAEGSPHARLRAKQGLLLHQQWRHRELPPGGPGTRRATAHVGVLPRHRVQCSVNECTNKAESILYYIIQVV